MINKEEKELQKLLQNNLLHKAPKGMLDRVMAHIDVIPAHRISIKPIEPSPILAFVIMAFTIALVLVGAITKPATYYSFDIPWEGIFNYQINPIWITPVLVISITIWGYVFINKKRVRL